MQVRRFCRSIESGLGAPEPYSGQAMASCHDASSVADLTAMICDGSPHLYNGVAAYELAAFLIGGDAGN